MIPNQQIDTLEATFLSLSNLGRQLSEDQWKLPTDCPGWSVQDNLSHLIGVEFTLSGGEHDVSQITKVRLHQKCDWRAQRK